MQLLGEWESLAASAIVLVACCAPGPRAIAQKPPAPNPQAAKLAELSRTIESAKLPDRLKAVRDLAGFGKDAVPLLIKALSNREGAVAEAATSALANLGAAAVEGLIEACRKSEAPHDVVPLLALSVVARQFTEALPTIAATIANQQQPDDIPPQLAWVLSICGPEGIPALVSLLGHPKWGRRQVALDALGHIALTTDEAIPPLARALDDEHEWVRWRALAALGMLGPRVRDHIVPIAKRLLDKKENVAVRRTAIWALQRIGPEAIAALVEADVAVVTETAASPPSKKGENKEDRLQSYEVFGGVDVRALPAAVALAKDDQRPVEWRVAALGLIETVGAPAKSATMDLVPFLVHSDVRLRIAAVRTLNMIGADDPAIVEQLGRSLSDNDPEVRRGAAMALEQTTTKDVGLVPTLVKLLADGDARVRGASAIALGSFGDAGSPGIPALLAMLEDPDQRLHSVAARALGGIGARASEAVPQLIQAIFGSKSKMLDLGQAMMPGLQDIDFYVALGHIGKAAVPELETVLAKNLSDEDAKKMVLVLRRIGTDAIPTLRTVAKAGSPDIRIWAAQTLLDLGAEPGDVLPVALDVLKSSSFRAREKALWIVDALGPKAKDALPAVARATQDTEAHVRLAAFRAIGSMKGDRAEFVKSAGDLLKKDPDPEIRERAAFFLKRTGPEAKAAIPALVSALRDKVPSVRSRACEALGEILPPTAESVDGLIQVIEKKEERDEVRIAAIEATGKMGPKAKKAVAALVSAEWLGSYDVRVVAAEALGKIGKDAASAVPVLVHRLLWAKPIAIRRAAAQALGQIGADAKIAAPALAWACEHSDVEQRRRLGFMSSKYSWVHIGYRPDVLTTNWTDDSWSAARVAAIVALGEIGPDPKLVAPVLARLSTDPDQAIQKAAADVAVRIRK
ncbi:MAG: HEAT repeat domain-containing protein [Planctomycetes bacterium]|nr:HEAT repeat domain-containing protein [Planctomycetota bacterium]MBI3847836.1 HEAT repeat domain-containing protein [Planctomycetota bacterium]